MCFWLHGAENSASRTPKIRRWASAIRIARWRLLTGLHVRMSLALLVREIPFALGLLRLLCGHLAAHRLVISVGMPSLRRSRNRRLRMFRLSFALLILSSFFSGVSHINKLLWGNSRSGCFDTVRRAAVVLAAWLQQERFDLLNAGLERLNRQFFLRFADSGTPEFCGRSCRGPLRR